MTPRRVSVGAAELETKHHALYRFYDPTDVLLYVGISMDLPARVKSHKRGKPWWTCIANIRVEHFATRKEALAAEKAAIKAEKPLWNDQHNPAVSLPRDPQDVMDGILRAMCGGPEEYEEALATASESYAEESAEYRADSDVTTYAVELMASEMCSHVFRLRDQLERLLAQFPIEQVRRCREEAITDLARWGIEQDPVEVLAETASQLEHELAKAYMAALPPEESADWRRLMVNELGREFDSGRFTSEIAAYARECKEDRAYIRYGMCTGPGLHGTPCVFRAAYSLRFSEDCNGDEPCEGPCIGHDYFCALHLKWFQTGRMTKGGRPAPAVLAYTEIDQSGMEAPF